MLKTAHRKAPRARSAEANTACPCFTSPVSNLDSDDDTPGRKGASIDDVLMVVNIIASRSRHATL